MDSRAENNLERKKKCRVVHHPQPRQERLVQRVEE